MRAGWSRRHWVGQTTGIIVALVILLVPRASLATPTVGAPVTEPAAVPVAQATELIVTSRITTDPSDPPVISAGVNLLRVDASNKVIAILGQMLDNGTNGDAVAGDQVFTLRLTETESTPGELRLRVSAPFQRTVLRVLSSVTVVPIGVDQNGSPTPISTPTSAATTATATASRTRTQVPSATLTTTATVTRAPTATTDRNLHSGTEQHTYTDRIIDSGTDRHSYGDRNSHVDVDGYRTPNQHAAANRYADGDADSHRNGNTSAE